MLSQLKTEQNVLISTTSGRSDEGKNVWIKNVLRDKWDKDKTLASK